MNREAVALGTPVYTTFSGRLGAVDGSLIERGLLRELGAARDLRVERKRATAPQATRDPAALLELMVSASR
jgi:predicted glycosyltransferase